MEKFKLPVHEHPLYRVGGNHIHGNYGLRLFCAGCVTEGHIDDGFRCSRCPLFYLHKNCGESALEINHPSHPQHPLNLLAGGSLCSGKRCRLCGVSLELLCYHCSICNFTIDTGCAINPPLPILDEQPKAHEHTLTLIMSTKTDFTCHVCRAGNRLISKYFYLCSICEFFFHIECASFSPEINHPCHPRHILKFLKSGSSRNSPCNLCGQQIKRNSCYHCSICNFTLDLTCVKNPPPLALVSPKTHNHQLALMPRLIYFTCNACGMAGDRSPYVCVQCNFMIHSQCVDLPGVIRINRHDHPISFTYDLDLIWDLVLECGVCRQTMNSSYGAYCCLKCKSYVVHSRCATKIHGWDGRDIEGEPEEIEDVAPFTVIGDNLIKHFTHEEHDMKLITKDGSVHEGTKDCKACIKPIGAAERFYKCIQCGYILHETCANFPRKIRSVLLPEKLALVGGVSYFHNTFLCAPCKRYSSGFRYTDGTHEIDLQCISISEPLKREVHHHPLYYFSEYPEDCNSCCEKAYYGFKCLKLGCKFSLDFNCATLPERVKHKIDNHTLRLCNGAEDPHEKYWCDICEKQVDHSKQYYTCDDCRTTLHIKCVLGDLFGNISPGSIINHEEIKYDRRRRYITAQSWHKKFEVVSNIGINRPLCCICHSRCTFSLVLKTRARRSKYVCSHDCLTNFVPLQQITM